MLTLDDLQYRFLCWRYARNDRVSEHSYSGGTKLQRLLGQDIFERTKDKVVLDFGCGYGDETIELARRGARLAVGLDIRGEVLAAARVKSGLLGNVQFATPDQCGRESADIIISLDSFEHFEDPRGVLDFMYDLLAPGGEVLASFGPPWRHPLGGHSFSVFPWSHLLLSERALCRWYNDTMDTKISRFGDVSGGLNRMTIASFERLVAESRFSKVSIVPVPIRALRHVHNRVTREYTTSVIKCELQK